MRAEVPGIDPDKDVEVTASEGVLHLAVEPPEEAESEGRRYLRHEFVQGTDSSGTWHCSRVRRDRSSRPPTTTECLRSACHCTSMPTPW